MVMRVIAFALCVTLALAATAEEAKAVRMKTTRQLREMMKEVGMKYDKDDSKEQLREHALEMKLMEKYEKKFPGKLKKKAPRGAAGPGGAGAGGMPSPDQMAGNLFEKADTNKDGSLSPKEVDVVFGAMAGGQGTEAPADLFGQIDTNGDGSASKAEVLAYVTQMAGRCDLNPCNNDTDLAPFIITWCLSYRPYLATAPKHCLESRGRFK